MGPPETYMFYKFKTKENEENVFGILQDILVKFAADNCPKMEGYSHEYVVRHNHDKPAGDFG